MWFEVDGTAISAVGVSLVASASVPPAVVPDVTVFSEAVACGFNRPISARRQYWPLSSACCMRASSVRKNVPASPIPLRARLAKNAVIRRRPIPSASGALSMEISPLRSACHRRANCAGWSVVSASITSLTSSGFGATDPVNHCRKRAYKASPDATASPAVASDSGKLPARAGAV